MSPGWSIRPPTCAARLSKVYLNSVFDGASEWPKPIELLPDTEALERWLVASRLVTAPRLKAALREWRDSEEAGAFLKELLAFRDHLRAAVLMLERGKMPSPDFVAELNELLQAHPRAVGHCVKKGQARTTADFRILHA